jgi:hypothetical protein
MPKEADALFEKAIAFSNAVAAQEKQAAAAAKQAKTVHDSVPAADIALRDTFKAAHEVNKRAIAQDVFKMAKEHGLDKTQAENLFGILTDEYVKGAAAMGAALEGADPKGEGDLPASPEEGEQPTPEDLMAVLQELVQAGVLTPEDAQKALTELAGAAQGGEGAAEGPEAEGAQLAKEASALLAYAAATERK